LGHWSSPRRLDPMNHTEGVMNWTATLCVLTRMNMKKNQSFFERSFVLLLQKTSCPVTPRLFLVPSRPLAAALIVHERNRGNKRVNSWASTPLLIVSFLGYILPLSCYDTVLSC
jgi:hypothetical protein